MSNLPSQFITGNPTFDSRHSDILNLIRNTGSYTYQAPSQTTVTKNEQAGTFEVDIEGLSPTKPKFDYISKIEHDQIPFVAMANIPSIFGKFEVYGFLEKSVNKEHLAIKCGDVDPYKCNVRIHSECWTGDVLGSMKCDCRDQLEAALKFIAQNGGIVLYLRQEGRGIGLLNKLKAYALQEQGYDTVEANIKLGFEDDLRTYESAVEMLKFFGIKRISLLTNNPKKINAIAAAGIEVDRQAHQLEANQYNINYLKTKAKKSGHILEFDKDAKQAEKNKPNVNTNPTTVLGNRITFVETENQKLRSEIERLASENEALKKNGTYLYSNVSSNQTVDTLKQNIAYITAENDRVAKLYHEKTAEIDALKKRVAELETRGSVPVNGLYYPYSYGGYNPYYAPYYSGLYKGI